MAKSKTSTAKRLDSNATKELKKPELPARIKKRLEGLPEKIGEHNTQLLKAFAEKHLALPSEPGAKRTCTVMSRLTTISTVLQNKALDELNEGDVQTLNLQMRERGFTSGSDYRKALRQFLRLTDKKKNYEVLESDFMRQGKKQNGEPLVDAEKFLTDRECEKLMAEVVRMNSPHIAAFEAVLLNSGMRPGEIIRSLRKKDVVVEE